MPLINTTALSFAQEDDGIFAKVSYFFDGVWVINNEETYRHPFTDEIPHTKKSIIYVHELNEGLIRHAQVKVRASIFTASNAIGLWPFLKNLFKIKQPSPQTIGQFNLPRIGLDQKLDLKLDEQIRITLELKPLPWMLLERIEFRETVVPPQIASMHYYPLKQQINLILRYPAMTEADYIFRYGESDDPSDT